MTREDINNVLGACLGAPDGQLCKSAMEKVQRCIDASNDELAQTIKDLLDDCAYFALASGFTMVLLDDIWNESKKLTQK
jgi:hypothetical protein